MVTAKRKMGVKRYHTMQEHQKNAKTNVKMTANMYHMILGLVIAWVKTTLLAT